MNNPTGTKVASVDKTINTEDLTTSSTSTDLSERSLTKSLNVQPRDVPTFDARHYDSKEVKVEKIIIE